MVAPLGGFRDLAMPVVEFRGDRGFVRLRRRRPSQQWTIWDCLTSQIMMR